ncbi:hypothetical protein MMC25_001874 [Agyrium rufum]|nr:hypothetical protein [Agyrium rufum]
MAGMQKAHEDPARAPAGESTNKDHNETNALLYTMRQLSLNNGKSDHLSKAHERPSLPNIATRPDHERIASSLSTTHPASSPLRRNPSSNSSLARNRSVTPTLHKKASLSSLASTGGATPPRSPAMRRTSSNLASSPQSGTFAMNGLRKHLPEDTPKPEVTPASAAQGYFKKELEAIMSEGPDRTTSELVVIIHDACYGHRFARPRAKKADLATIVERPERILATVLGLAAAYVRLGGKHAAGRSPPNPYSTPDPSSFPLAIHRSTRRVSLTSQAASSVHGLKWMQELSTMCREAESKLATKGKELARVPDAVDGESAEEKPKFHEGDLYLCSESLDSLEGALGGVCDAVDRVFDSSITERAFVSIRPPGHHCSADYPSGFCWINNVLVGIAHAANTHGLTHAAVIDFDLHHGDGSQAVVWAHNSARVNKSLKNATPAKKSTIGYFSLHDINSYPCEWGDEEKVRSASLCVENAHGQSIWNVHLQPWRTEADFWELYETRYMVLIEKARAFLRQSVSRSQETSSSPKPKAAIFISAGFDASEWEGAGMQRHKANVPTEFYARFTRDIVALSTEEGTGVEGRVISVLEGGYSDRALTSGVLSHICGLSSSEKNPTIPLQNHDLGREMANRLGKLQPSSETSYTLNSPTTASSYDRGWWSSSSLDDLESYGKSPFPTPSTRKPTNGLASTYATPTESFTAKIISPPQNRRSMSGQIIKGPQRPASSMSSRPPSPPPPDVDWVTATHALCKLLVPTSRSTTSYRHEDLNAEATRVRKERQSTIGLPANHTTLPEGQRMQLRDRRTKAPLAKTDDQELKAASRSSRRRTIASAEALAKESIEASDVLILVQGVKPKAPLRRRSSAASGVMTTLDELRSTSNGQLDGVNGSSHEASRTSSSLAVRPGSASDHRFDLPMKKSRPPISSSTDGRSNTGMNARSDLPPIPRVPSTYTKKATGDAAAKSAPKKSTVSISRSTSQDIDDLASGMHKVSLKLTAPKKPDSQPPLTKAKPAARAPRKSAVPRQVKAAPKAVLMSEADKLASALPSEGPAPGVPMTAPPQHIPETTAVGKDMTTYGAPIEQGHSAIVNQETTPPSSMPTSGPSVPAMTSNLPTFPEEPISPPSLKEALPAKEPMRTTPVSITPDRLKRELPVFTSSSPIHFGPRPMPAQNLDSVMKLGKPSDNETQTAIRRMADMKSDHQVASHIKQDEEVLNHDGHTSNMHKEV